MASDKKHVWFVYATRNATQFYNPPLSCEVHHDDSLPCLSQFTFKLLITSDDPHKSLELRNLGLFTLLDALLLFFHPLHSTTLFLFCWGRWRWRWRQGGNGRNVCGVKIFLEYKTAWVWVVVSAQWSSEQWVGMQCGREQLFIVQGCTNDRGILNPPLSTYLIAGVTSSSLTLHSYFPSLVCTHSCRMGG